MLYLDAHSQTSLSNVHKHSLLTDTLPMWLGLLPSSITSNTLSFVHLIFVCLLPLLLLLLLFDTFPNSSYFHYKSSINTEKYNYYDKASNAGHGDEKWIVTGRDSSCHMQW